MNVWPSEVVMKKTLEQQAQTTGGSSEEYFGIEFASIESTLLLYCKALTGKEIDFDCAEVNATSLRNQWFRQMASGNIPDGHIRISVPANYMDYATYGDNFNWYKAFVTQQVAHVEFGSFDFCFEKESRLYANLRREMQLPHDFTGSDMARYLSLFEEPVMAKRIFVAVENSRINYLAKYFYPGLKRSYARMQESTLLALSQVPGMTLRRAFCELIEGLEFYPEMILDTGDLQAPLTAAGEILALLRTPASTVEDSCEATIRIYNIAAGIPRNAFVSSAGGYAGQQVEINFSGMEELEFMGDFDADEMKLHMKMRPGAGPKSSMPMTTEELKKLADQTIGITGVQNAQFLSGTGLSAADLPRGVQVVQFPQSKYQQAGSHRPKDLEEIKRGDGEKLFFYDEWDFRNRKYLNEWCCVREKVQAEGSSHFYEKTVEDKKSLAAEIKRQFEKLPAELFYRARNLDDGDEYDLDLVISELMDKRAGQTPSGEVYWKKKKIQRDVAVAFLLDMSGSTADLVNKSRQPMEYDESIKYDFMKFVMQPRRRIIDLEKESVVLLIQAIESLGDNYGIYGFSGHGHSKVQFMVIKDLNECFSEKVKRRVDTIAPIHGTRMGPAIRHAIKKLDTCGSALKLLFLVSDGYPQDSMYGHNDDDKEYAIHDTKMALIEASQKNITPFCLTVDSAGNDYLRTMCNDIGYEVLDDIETLPRRLPMLYKKLSV